MENKSYFRVASDRNQLCEWLQRCSVESSNVLDDLAWGRAWATSATGISIGEDPSRILLLTYVTYSYSYSLWASVQTPKAQGKESSCVHLSCSQLWIEGGLGEQVAHAVQTWLEDSSSQRSGKDLLWAGWKPQKILIIRLSKSSKGNKLIKN